MFSAPSEWLIFFNIFSHKEVFKILSEFHVWLGMYNPRKKSPEKKFPN